jgi:hypothetical protein
LLLRPVFPGRAFTTYWRSDLPHSGVELAFGRDRNLQPFGRLFGAALGGHYLRLVGRVVVGVVIAGFVETSPQLRPAETKVALKAKKGRVPVPDQPPIFVDRHWLTSVLAINQERFFVVYLDGSVALFLHYPTDVSPSKRPSRFTSGFADALHEPATVIRTAPHRS